MNSFNNNYKKSLYDFCWVMLIMEEKKTVTNNRKALHEFCFMFPIKVHEITYLIQLTPHISQQTHFFFSFLFCFECVLCGIILECFHKAIFTKILLHISNIKTL